MSKLGLKDKLDRVGNLLVSGFQVTALFVIGATIVWSAVVGPTVTGRASTTPSGLMTQVKIPSGPR